MNSENKGVQLRFVSYEALSAIWHGEDSSAALSRIGKEKELDQQDLGLAWMITMTILRNRDLLDCAIDSKLDRKKIDPIVRDVLRIGAVQILMLDRVPSFAAVSTAVDLCKHIGVPRAAGLVNAVLRKLCDMTEHEIPLPKDKRQRMATEFSHPVWLIGKWAESEGYEFASALAAANNVEAPTVCRVNIRAKTPRQTLEFLLGQGVEARQIPNFPDYISIEAPGHPETLPGFAEGYFSPQDPAFTVPVDLLEPLPGQRVLEIGCAPGGKLTHIAERYGGDIEIHGVDISKERIDLARENLVRLGLSHLVNLHVEDGRKFGEPASFDWVLIDAPCTSLGVIRRHPEIRYRRKMQDILNMARVQSELIAAGLRVLKPGGSLVYCACSTEPEEGENHMKNLPSGVQWTTPRDYQPANFMQGKVLRTWPHIHNLDGMVAFRVRTPKR